MSRHQKREVREILLENEVAQVLHGGCMGADWDFHQIVLALMPERQIDIVVRPSDRPETYPLGIRKLMRERNCPVDLAWLDLGAGGAWTPMPPKVRDKAMVDRLATTKESVLIAAAPDNRGERVFSGTWATVRFARAQHVLRIVVRPNGKVEKEG